MVCDLSDGIRRVVADEVDAAAVTGVECTQPELGVFVL